MVPVERRLFLKFNGLDLPKRMRVFFSGLRRYAPCLIAVVVFWIRGSGLMVEFKVQGSRVQGLGLGVYRV